MGSTLEEKKYEAEQIVKWAKFHGIDMDEVVEALCIIRSAMSSGLTIDTYYSYGAADIMNFYKSGIEKGRRMAKEEE